MRQTTKKWFETIEDPKIRAKAIANTSTHKLKTNRDSLVLSLYSAFSWISSPEGYEYWSDFIDTLETK
jgi:hypothetical protein